MILASVEDKEKELLIKEYIDISQTIVPGYYHMTYVPAIYDLVTPFQEDYTLDEASNLVWRIVQYERMFVRGDINDPKIHFPYLKSVW